MSQRELATHLNISVTGVSKRLSGKTPIDVNELRTIAAVLGVPLLALIEDEA